MPTKDDPKSKYETLTYYADYLSNGFILELLRNTEKGKTNDVRIDDISRLAKMYRMTSEEKRQLLKKAFEVLDPEDVMIEMFYDIKAIYSRIIREILMVASDEVKEEILENYDDIGIEKYLGWENLEDS
jgi:cyclopropane fatty-acyl-phospholipid synthase-like methyltransferase